MKHKLNEICKRYEKSGDGAGQLDDDGDEACNEEENFGHFNMELATLMGGDDRQNFLNHDPIDLLYWWDIMDHHHLTIHFTTAQLRGDHAVSSDSMPSMTSYYPSRKKQKNEANDLIQKGISTNVKVVGTALSRMNQQSAMSDINNLVHNKREFMNEWRKERKLPNYDSDVDDEYYTSALQEL
jgi:hypothetical protein